MGEHRDELTEDDLFDELRTKLLPSGVHRRPGAIELPRLEEVAKLLASDSSVSLRDQIQEALALAAEHLARARELAVIDLLDFGVKPIEKPDREDRRLHAAERLGLGSSEYFRKKIEKPLLRELAGHLARLAADGRRETQINEAQSSTITPAQPSEDTSVATDPETLAPTPAASDASHSDDAEDQDPEIEREQTVTTTPPQPAPKAPSIETETKPPERRDRRGARLIKWLMPGYSAIITYAVALLVMALAVILPTGGGASTISGSCGPTTAQLVPQENLDSWAHLYMFAPHQEKAQHGWSGELAYFLNEPKHKEIFHPGETRLVALSYTDEEPGMPVVATVTLGGGASIVPNTTCLYRDGHYSKGTRYAKNPLTQAKGLKIEHLASQARVYITFRELLPANAPEGSIVDTYGWVGPENRHEDESTHGQARIYIKLTR